MKCMINIKKYKSLNIIHNITVWHHLNALQIFKRFYFRKNLYLFTLPEILLVNYHNKY